MMVYNGITPSSGAILTKGYAVTVLGSVPSQGRPQALNKNGYFVQFSFTWRDPIGERI